MERFSYTVVLTHEGDSYAVHVPALPGCVTYGDSVEHALEMAEEAIGLWLHGDVPTLEQDGVKVLTARVTVEVEVVDGVVRTPGVIEAPAAAAVGT
jgi:predicted RNase H-like HicB family nuclease